MHSSIVFATPKYYRFLYLNFSHNYYQGHAQDIVIPANDSSQRLLNSCCARAGAGRDCGLDLRWGHRLGFYCIAGAQSVFTVSLYYASNYHSGSSDERAGTYAQSNLRRS